MFDNKITESYENSNKNISSNTVPTYATTSLEKANSLYKKVALPKMI